MYTIILRSKATHLNNLVRALSEPPKRAELEDILVAATKVKIQALRLIPQAK